MPYEKQFAALSHPLRQQIIANLQAGPSIAGELAASIDASQPVISQHLKVLRDAGLIQVDPKGTKRFYRINPSELEALRDFLTQHWQKALSGLTDKEDLND